MPQLGCSYYLSKDFKAKIDHHKLDPYNKMMDCSSPEKEHRPVLFAMNDPQNPDIMWMVPSTTNVISKQKIIDDRIDKAKDKGKKIDPSYLHAIKVPTSPYDMKFNKRLQKDVVTPTALLLQNMFPITKEYISQIHVDRNTGKPIKAPDGFFAEVEHAVKTILNTALARSKNLAQDVTFTGEHMKLPNGERLYSNVKGLKKMLEDEQRIELSQEYQAVATNYPDRSILIEKENHIYALGDTAKTLANILNTKPEIIFTGTNDTTEMLRIPQKKGNMEKLIGELLREGKKVAVKKISGEVIRYKNPQRENEIADEKQLLQQVKSRESLVKKKSQKKKRESER